jgi:hypothetical protein
VTGGASLDPTLWQPARTIDPSAMKRSLDRIVFILLGLGHLRFVKGGVEYARLTRMAAAESPASLR